MSHAAGSQYHVDAVGELIARFMHPRAMPYLGAADKLALAQAHATLAVWAELKRHNDATLPLPDPETLP